VRAGGGADDLGVDAEVPERLDEARGGLLLAGGVGLGLLGAGALEDPRVGQLVLDVGGVEALEREGLLVVDVLGLVAGSDSAGGSGSGSSSCGGGATAASNRSG
jgi:hypothetical protein